MNAILPLNIAAVRVNNNDRLQVANNFQGKTAVFEKMPWADPLDSYATQASTGDKIFQALGIGPGGGPMNAPTYTLGDGIHLHWELPAYFKKGKQSPDSTKIVFPHAPNRWLVTRYLSIFDTGTNSYGAPTSKSWVVESDYVTADKSEGPRPRISVPLPAKPNFRQQPFMYMGRVVDLEDWNPASESASDYLPSHNGDDGEPCYLTSIGFVGPYFASYYPECRSVFGFWDNFSDVPDVQSAINNSTTLQFRATYQVIGWLSDASTDPLDQIDAQVTSQYEDYVQKSLDNNATPQLTPLDFFKKIMDQTMNWSFNTDDLSASVDSNYKITSLKLPTQTLCAGTMQEVVWNMTSDEGTTYFLSASTDPATPSSVWTAPTEIAIGNSTEEALSALLKFDMGQTEDDANLTNYEYLLDALQLGLLSNIEKTPNKLITLEEALHKNGFARLSGGFTWLITNTAAGDNDGKTESEEVSLPLSLAEQLYLLNKAQKQYDMGRGALSTRRKQLFMDWVRYVKMYQGETSESYISQSTISNFMWTSSGGELNDVIQYGQSVGILQYTSVNSSGVITGISPPDSSVLDSSLAYAVWKNYNTVKDALEAFSVTNPGTSWQLQSGIADSFELPAEPVILMEGDMMEPPQRAGSANGTFVRLSQELLSRLAITYKGSDYVVDTSELSAVPQVSSKIPSPIQADVQTLTGEAFLITPMLVPAISSKLDLASDTTFTTALMYAQGGLSPLDLTPTLGGIPAPLLPVHPSDSDPAPPPTSLYEMVNAADYQPAADPVINVSAPAAMSVSFTNKTTNGWPAGSIGWNTQKSVPEFSKTRVDPFLPIFMIWNINVSPLKWDGNSKNKLYSTTNLTDYFELDSDGVDYINKSNGSTPVPFTASTSVSYEDDATMRSGATGVLSYQITNYISNNPGDSENDTLKQIAAMYDERKILSQAISGFNTNQVLTAYVAQVAIENLVAGKMDNITPKLNTAAGATPHDNWYDDAVTSLEPVPTGLEAEGNFGPLRAGFMDVIGIEIVDVFGQRMKLKTTSPSPTGGLSCITSYAMTPDANDKLNKGRIYLAPRLLAPSRVWFKWLSAVHNDDVTGVSTDFVETNSHPATAPICGWVMPNHLDNDLFFYDSDGNPIGTFGVEHEALVYRTRAGNIDNKGSSEQQLTADIGKSGSPTVNAHVANFMWYLFDQTGKFLEDLMTGIEDSASFVNPANSAQDNSLAVLIGNPLALTRVVLGIETRGNLLPLSQADNNAQSPFPQDVNNDRVSYPARMEHSSANLGDVNFPCRLGDLVNLDDGLVGYVLETGDTNPYHGQSLYMPAANDQWTNGVSQPKASTIELTLNETPIRATLLVDPRAAVHATTGVLGVSEIAIPPDQYTAIMNSLAVNFVTRPMLLMQQGLTVPLPAENGYAWSWITPGASVETPLKANAANEKPVYGYTPQSLQEGWLELKPEPKS